MGGSAQRELLTRLDVLNMAEDAHAAGHEDKYRAAREQFDHIVAEKGHKAARKWANREIDKLKRTVKDKWFRYSDMLAYKNALEWLINAFDAMKIEPLMVGSPSPSVPDVRRLSKIAILSQSQLDSEKAAPVAKRWRESVWFDMRKVPYTDSRDMAAFGKDLVERGIIKMPFDQCVFVLSVMDGDKSATVCQRLEMGDGEVMASDACLFGDGFGSLHVNFAVLSDEHYYFLACMNTKYFCESEHAYARSQSTPRGGPASYSYRVIEADPARLRIDATGSHAAPRLHWRRGHTRTTPTGKVTWVNAHLVGSKSRGIIVHDYACPNPPEI